MSSNRQLALFLVIAFGFSWLCWVPDALVGQGFAVSTRTASAIRFISSFGAWGPLVAALAVTTIAEGRSGLLDLWRRVSRFRLGVPWYLVALALFPLLIGGALGIAILSGEPAPELPALERPWELPIAFLFILVLGGPLQEELGWRAVLQERLQERWDAFAASLMVGFTWGLWHLPLFFLPREEFYYNRPVWGLILTTMLISVLFAWLYNNTRKSVWAVLLFHTSFNWSHYVFPSLGSDVAGLSLFCLQALMLVAVVYAYGPRTLTRSSKMPGPTPIPH
ncbi:MAG: CPBP family intramembrane metalloprotease [bacterium]|nr:CPBP family intramembrane metalloprotease [bacterium]